MGPIQVYGHMVIACLSSSFYSRRRSSERLKAEEARSMLETIDAKYLHRQLGDAADAVLLENQLKTFSLSSLKA